LAKRRSNPKETLGNIYQSSLSNQHLSNCPFVGQNKDEAARQSRRKYSATQLTWAEKAMPTEQSNQTGVRSVTIPAPETEVQKIPRYSQEYLREIFGEKENIFKPLVF